MNSYNAIPLDVLLSSYNVGDGGHPMQNQQIHKTRPQPYQNQQFQNR